jgi:hypothetical protein
MMEGIQIYKSAEFEAKEGGESTSLSKTNTRV